MSTFDSTKLKLDDLLKDILIGKIQLPNFQRGWVWDDEHIRSLLISIARSFPIGAIMLLETGGEACFQVRAVEGVSILPGNDPSQLILDGQQRLTSLTQVLKLTEAVMTRDEKKREIRRHYYFDIKKALEGPLALEEALFAVDEGKVLRTNFGRDIVLDLSTTEKEYEAFCFPCNQILNANPWMYGLMQFRQDLVPAFLDFSQKVLEPYRSYMIPVIILKKETSKEAVCLVFEKVNTGGVALSVFELMTATYAADGFNLRQDWFGEKAISGRKGKMVSKPLLRDLEPTDFLQGISLLNSYERRQADLAAGKKGKEAAAVTAKREHILALPLSAYKKWAEPLSQGFFEAEQFLRHMGFYHPKYLPYRTQLIPLAAILTHIKDRWLEPRIQDKLSRWFWCGVFGELYGGAVETRIALDLQGMLAWIESDDAPEPDTVAAAGFQQSRLDTLRTRLSAAYRGLYVLLQQLGARDFYWKTKMIDLDRNDKGIDIHHIFPRKWCEEQDPRIADLACGSGGMFVQSSHFIEHLGQDTMKRVTFYGQEKTGTTIKLAKMNLAVHGLEGDIREANTFYNDVHRLPDGRPLWSNCDFVMANPPFNVDQVDSEKIKDDRRLPFGLPGVNKAKKVSNGNYLWISYFHSYLGPKGRAGFVMSSQASSAGHTEAEVRRRIVETGDVDVMISIRSNFFYTRTVPCELWHFDKGKPEDRRDSVLMLDARNIYHKVNRKVFDFTPEQLQNLTAIVWLYRGEEGRFLDLVRGYFAQICEESAKIPTALDAFDVTLAATHKPIAAFQKTIAKLSEVSSDKKQPLADALKEWSENAKPYEIDGALLLKELSAFRKKHEPAPPEKNKAQHAARQAFDPTAERLKGLVKRVDLLYKLASRAAHAAAELAAKDVVAEFYDRRAVSKSLKQLDEHRKAAVEQLKLAAYFHRQVVWLQDRFPDAGFAPVPGLCKIVSRSDIEAADWSLTPGRYVGVTPAEVDEDFDFEETIRDIHIELDDLNQEAETLAKKIQENFEVLGA